MPLIKIDSAQDPRVAPYVDLRNKQLSVRHGRFIAEGELVVQRLLNSRFAIESLLVAESQLGRITAPESVPVYHASLRLIEAIAGFRFHRGILACGIRPAPLDWARQLPPPHQPATIVVCSAIRDPENLGGVLRNCAAFGVDLVLIGDHSADPWSRRVLRVSMATALKLPIGLSQQLDQDLSRLVCACGFQGMATVLDPAAQPLAATPRPRRLALVLGNEFSGVDAAIEQLCQTRVTIPMSLATDSLNVAVASGIFLYHFLQLAEQPPSAGR